MIAANAQGTAARRICNATNFIPLSPPNYSALKREKFVHFGIKKADFVETAPPVFCNLPVHRSALPAGIPIPARTDISFSETCPHSDNSSRTSSRAHAAVFPLHECTGQSAVSPHLIEAYAAAMTQDAYLYPNTRQGDRAEVLYVYSRKAADMRGTHRNKKGTKKRPSGGSADPFGAIKIILLSERLCKTTFRSFAHANLRSAFLRM